MPDNSQYPDDQQGPDGLLKKVSQAGADSLLGAVKEVEGLTEAQHAASKRAEDNKLSKNWKKVLKYIQWAVGISAIFLILVLIGLLTWILFTYAQNIIESPEEVEKALGFVFQTILIVLATAFIDRNFFRDKSK